MEPLITVERVTGGPLNVNTYILGREDKNECLLVDPGAEYVRVKRVVGDRIVRGVLLTHGHYDHILYVNEWLAEGAALYAHKEDVPMLLDPALNLSLYYDQSLTVREPDVPLADNERITPIGLDIKVMHTPGHTPGSVSFLCGDRLFSGDTLFHCGFGRTDLPGGSGTQISRSLQRLLRMDPSLRVYPGHGEETEIGKELRYYR